MEGLQLYCICPVVPSDCQLSESVLQYLKLSITRELECAAQNGGGNDMMRPSSRMDVQRSGTPTRSKFRGNPICTHESYSRFVASNAMAEKKEEYYLVDEWLQYFQKVKDYDSSGQYVGDKYMFKANGMRETMRCFPIKMQGPLIFGFDQQYQRLVFEDDRSLQPEWRAVFGESPTVESLEVSSIMALSTSLASNVDERSGYVPQNDRRYALGLQTPDRSQTTDMFKRLSLSSPNGRRPNQLDFLSNVMAWGGKKEYANRLAAMSAVPVVLLAFPRVKSVAVLTMLQPTFPSLFPSLNASEDFARNFPQNETELYFRRVLSPHLILTESVKLHNTNASSQCTKPFFTRDERDYSTIFLSNSETVHLLKVNWMRCIHSKLVSSALEFIDHCQQRSKSGTPGGTDCNKSGITLSAVNETSEIICTALAVDSDCQFRGTISLPGCNFGHLLFVRRREGALVVINLTRITLDERARKREREMLERTVFICHSIYSFIVIIFHRPLHTDKRLSHLDDFICLSPNFFIRTKKMPIRV